MSRPSLERPGTDEMRAQLGIVASRVISGAAGPQAAEPAAPLPVEPAKLPAAKAAAPRARRPKQPAKVPPKKAPAEVHVTRSGTRAKPYPRSDGKGTVKVAFAGTDDFVEELRAYTAVLRPPWTRNGWLEHVVREAMKKGVGR